MCLHRGQIIGRLGAWTAAEVRGLLEREALARARVGAPRSRPMFGMLERCRGTDEVCGSARCSSRSAAGSAPIDFPTRLEPAREREVASADSNEAEVRCSASSRRPHTTASTPWSPRAWKRK